VQIPDFLDNGDPKTYQVLDHYLREEPRADFASGYFNLGGYGLRLFTEGFFHAKAYIFDNVGVLGCSNFTAAGLTSHSELNSVHKQGYAANELRE
jgi:phosphatidylserine/phosphatidylglycerophosphate/cardiolipin synthase-like enzyme